MSETIDNISNDDKDKIIPLTPGERAFTIGVRQRDENYLRFLAGMGGLGKDQKAITLYELSVLDKESGNYGDTITSILAGAEAVDARVIVDVAYELGTPTEEDWAKSRVAAQVAAAKEELMQQAEFHQLGIH